METKIEESMGFCKVCGVEDTLGDGLCLFCYDKERGKNKYLDKKEHENPQEPFLKAGYYITTIKCVDCNANVLVRVKIDKKPYTKYRCFQCNKKRRKERGW